MNERLPYEDQLAQQWNDLPLPDENLAWDDMKRRLDEDDDDKIIPIWLRGCGLWGLVAIVMIGIGWWLIRPDRWWNKKQETENVSKTNEELPENDPGVIPVQKGVTKQLNNDSNQNVLTTGVGNNPDHQVIDSTSIETAGVIGKKQNKPVEEMNVTVTPAKTSKRIRRNSINQTISQSNKKPVSSKVIKQDEKEHAEITVTQPVKMKKDNEVVETKDGPVVLPADTMTMANKFLANNDSVLKKQIADSTAKTNKPDSLKRNSISFSAGLGMHQLLPIAGQHLNPYNSAGRKGSLADYIPSAFARMYRNNKWFLQLEFRYGAPQYNKDFLYRQNLKTDSVGSISFTTTTSSTLKKTFYHQLPLTFNYFILPGWSIGTGVVWNKFVSAVSQQQIDRRNNSTQTDSILSNAIVKDKNDSAFKKSYFQAVFETHYQWQRLSAGARYSFGLEPYIKFSLPGGAQGREKNQSIQVFIRYELWKQKQKK